MSDLLVWGQFTQPGLDAAYNNMAAFPDSGDRLADWAGRSAALRIRQPDELEIPYGAGPRNRFDMFRCGRRNAPLLVFIHGGWWQRNSKEVFSCLAEGLLALNFDVALLGYTLAPEASLTQIVREILAGLDAVAKHQAAHGLPGRCLLSGWSAGGHLAAMTLEHPSVMAGISISGVFDLEPIRLSYINDKLRLDPAEAAAMSPARRERPSKPIVLAFGLLELPELQRQSLEYFKSTGQAEILPLAGHDHFSILEELASPEGIIARKIASLA